jgi:hypothetical protein
MWITPECYSEKARGRSLRAAPNGKGFLVGNAGWGRSALWDMSESAAIIKSFFVPSCATLLAPHTLPVDGAEDKALPGGNLSADSGAKTRLGPVSN